MVEEKTTYFSILDIEHLVASKDFLILCGLALILLLTVLIVVVLCVMSSRRKPNANGYNRAATRVRVTVLRGVLAIAFEK